MAEIVELILADHARIRGLFAELGTAGGAVDAFDRRPALGRLWETLAGLLELHFDAEEEICHFALFGTEAEAARDFNDALADHNDIREAVREARLLAVGCPAWWRAVRAARRAALDHIDGREADALRHFQRRASLQMRGRLGRQWAAFVAARMLDAAAQDTGHEPGALHDRPVLGAGVAMGPRPQRQEELAHGDGPTAQEPAENGADPGHRSKAGEPAEGSD